MSASNQPTLRIAMSAHSLIYAPFYVAVQEVNKETQYPFRVELDFGPDRRGYGDKLAWRQLNPRVGDACHLCLCDPMPMAQNTYSKLRDNRPDGQMIAILVRRPALWAVVVGPEERNGNDALLGGGAEESGSIANRLQVQHDDTINFGKVWIYDDDSSAKHYLSYYKDRISTISIESDKMGKELEFFARNPDANPVDIVVTCECTHAYDYARRYSRPENKKRVIYAWHRDDNITNVPFTALIANRRMIRDRDEYYDATIDFLEILDKQLKKVRGAIQPMLTNDMAATAFLTKAGNITVPGDINDNLYTEAFSRLRDPASSIYPESIRPDRFERDCRKVTCGKSPWNTAYSDIWKISSDVKQAKRSYKKCCNARLARVAVPRWNWEKIPSAYQMMRSSTNRRDTALPAILSPLLIALIAIMIPRFQSDTPSDQRWNLSDLPGAESITIWFLTLLIIGGRVWYRRRKLKKVRS